MWVSTGVTRGWGPRFRITNSHNRDDEPGRSICAFAFVTAFQFLPSSNVRFSLAPDDTIEDRVSALWLNRRIGTGIVCQPVVVFQPRNLFTVDPITAPVDAAFELCFDHQPNPSLRELQCIRGRSLKKIDERICNFCSVVIRNSRSRTLHILHQAVEVIARVGNTDHADCGAIPYVAGVEFGDGDVETGAQAVFQAAHDLSLVFQGMGGFDLEFERKEGDGHAAVGRWSFVVGQSLATGFAHDQRRTTNDSLRNHFRCILSVANASIMSPILISP